jgi:hypothetical protein
MFSEGYVRCKGSCMGRQADRQVRRFGSEESAGLKVGLRGRSRIRRGGGGGKQQDDN